MQKLLADLKQQKDIIQDVSQNEENSICRLKRAAGYICDIRCERSKLHPDVQFYCKLKDHLTKIKTLLTNSILTLKEKVKIL